jgi:hypothetical protein
VLRVTDDSGTVEVRGLLAVIIRRLLQEQVAINREPVGKVTLSWSVTGSLNMEHSIYRRDSLVKASKAT